MTNYGALGWNVVQHPPPPTHTRTNIHRTNVTTCMRVCLLVCPSNLFFHSFLFSSCLSHPLHSTSLMLPRHAHTPLSSPALGSVSLRVLADRGRPSVTAFHALAAALRKPRRFVWTQMVEDSLAGSLRFLQDSLYLLACPVPNGEEAREGEIRRKNRKKRRKGEMKEENEKSRGNVFFLFSPRRRSVRGKPEWLRNSEFLLDVKEKEKK